MNWLSYHAILSMYIYLVHSFYHSSTYLRVNFLKFRDVKVFACLKGNMLQNGIDDCKVRILKILLI